MLQWGVIGCGGIAARRTIPEGILPSARCELSAVMDINGDQAARVASKYKVPRYFDSVDDLLSIPEIQVVYIASPNDCHKDQIIAAAHAGKHILVEKPIALSIADAEAAISACGRSGVKLMAGYMMRFHALHVRLQAMIQNGELGQSSGGRMKAYLSDQENYAALQERPKAEGAIPLLADPVNPYRGEIEHFVDCIELDQEPMTGAEPALHNLKVVLAAYESARLGKVIEIS